MFRKLVLAALCSVLLAATALSQTASSVVDYSFYLPATVNGYLYAGASTTDAAGNTYIAGTFPNRQNGNSQNGFFVAKYNAAGEQLFNVAQSPSFVGTVSGIAVDSSGKVYVVGGADTFHGRLQTTPNAYQTTPPAYSGGFLSVVSADGSTLLYSTYFAGSGGALSAVAVDSSGNAYVGGTTSYVVGSGIPVTPGAQVSTPTGKFGSGFLAKFNPNASGAASLVYSTYIGAPGSYIVGVANVAVDTTDNAYVTGNNNGAVYPTTPGAYAYNGRDSGNDVFVSKVNPSGTGFVYSVLLGPGSGNAIALDSSNNAYITGSVYEDDYPTTSNAYQTTDPSGFVTELNAAGSALVASTFLGGPNDSYASVTPTHIALPPGCASNCPVYVAGYSSGSDLPLVDPVQSYVSSLPTSKYSGFYTELAGGLGSVLQSSYFASGSGFDQYQAVPGLGVDSTGNIYLVGDALPSQLPVTQAPTGPIGEGFLAKIAPTAGARIAVSPSNVTFPQQIVSVSTTQEGLAPQIVQLENLGSEAAAVSSIKLSTNVFSQTNNCNGTVPAGGYCTLTLSFTPSAASTTASPQAGTVVVASATGGSATAQLSGTAINDRYMVASCGATPCAALTYADTVVGLYATAQTVTVTNLGATSVPFSSIASNLPDYAILTNCPQSGGGLGKGKSCEVSVQFHPTQVGLRAGTLTLASSGTTANTIAIPLSGTGLLSPNPSSLVLMEKTLNFGTTTVGATSGTLSVTVFNNGSAPATVFAPTLSTTGDAAGASDYAITANTCSQVVPQGSCSLTLAFSPTATGTRSGTLTVPTSASSTALTSSLTGIGVAEKQTLEFSPSAFTFAEQVIDSSSSATQVGVYNVGPAPVSIDRVLISGQYQITVDHCSQTTLAAAPLSGAYAYCPVQIVFSPTSTGAQSGTLTVIDTEGKQSALSLAGTGAAKNGSILASVGTLNFGSLGAGTTSAAQSFNIYNVGSSPVTVTGFSTTGDFGAYTQYCTPPYTVAPGTGCGPYFANFTPTKAASPDKGTFVLSTSAGNSIVNLTGVGETAAKTLALTPPGATGVKFGSVAVGSTANGGQYRVNLYNTGTDAITFSASPTITGSDSADFGIPSNGCGGSGSTLAAGGSCFINLQFSPAASGARSAVLTVTDNASTGSGVQTFALSGTGTTTVPPYTILPETEGFAPTAVNTASQESLIEFFNNGSAPITISTIAFQPTGNFTAAYNYGTACNGATVASGGSCYIGATFTPTTTGALQSTMTITDSKGNKYTSQLYGYSAPQTDSLFVNPVGLVFSAQPQLSTSAGQQILVYNYGTLAASIGQATGSNLIVGSSAAGAFKVTNDSCSNTSQRANYPYPCGISIVLTPTASTSTGTQTGSLKIPVTYGDGKTSSYTVSLSGTVVAPSDSAELSPSAITFLDQAVNTPASAGQNIYLTNTGNLPLTVGFLSATNTSSAGPFILANGSCQGAKVNPGGNCVEEVVFAPTTVANGIKGTLSFPITYADGKTATLTATYSGNALAAKNSLVISPDSANFGSEIVGQSTNVITFSVTNNGNQPVTFGAYALTSTQPGTNFVRDPFDYNSCSNSTLAVGLTCSFRIYFAPQQTGVINGTLTIADGAATGGPHNIALTGTGLSANQTIAVSQTTINFGNQPVGSGSLPQAIYVTNQSTSPVHGLTYTLGGINASDFSLNTNNCGSAIDSSGYGEPETCSFLVSFNPAKNSLGARMATVTVAFTGSGSPIIINLNGTGVPPSPAVTLFPTSLVYPTQAVGSKSASQSFSLYNTGSANLTIGTVVSTNAAEFDIDSNACAGKTLAPGQSCLTGVEFSPSAAGSLKGTIQITDNAGNLAGSIQSESLSGTGVIVPLVTLSANSLAFASQNVGSASAAQTLTVSNPGATALTIASIALTGADPADFLKSTNCGTTLASKGSCAITVEFAPKATGSLAAAVTLTDNANGVAGSTQSIALGGTGIGVPIAAASPGSLTFAAEAEGAASAAQPVTLTNSGTAALAIADVALIGADPGDFTLANGCAATLAVGAECTVSVVFDPKATGARSAALVFTDNSGLATGATQSVSLSGTGVALAATPTFSPAPGTYAAAQTVTLSDATIGSTIYYTTNGTAPTTNSAKYTGPIKVSATETIEAIAVSSGYASSATAVGAYTIK